MSRAAASFPRSSLRSSLRKLAAIYYRLRIVATCYCNLRKDIFVVSSLFAVMIMLSDSYSINNRYLLRVFDVLDEHSYTLYLVHGIVFCGIIDKFEVGLVLRVLIAVVGTAFLTWIVHKLYEKPVQSLLRKVMK